MIRGFCQGLFGKNSALPKPKNTAVLKILRSHDPRFETFMKRPADAMSQLPSTLYSNSLVAHVDSCAPAHFDLSVLASYVACVPAALFTHCFPCNFAFYVAHPICSIH